MTRWSFRKPGAERSLPPPTKFDKLSDTDLFIAVEHALANASVELGKWRTDPDHSQRDAHLPLVEIQLETALAALRPMIRRSMLRSGQ
jgi:hypothetical protein